VRRLLAMVTGSMLCLGLSRYGQQTAAPPAAQTAPPPPSQAAVPAPANPNNLGSDANGNPLRRAARTGHVSNYDESKVPPYTLPDPLVSANGKRVTDARAWRTQRRPEILKLYEAEIFGRIPAHTPKVTWAVAETDPAGHGGTTVTKKVVGTMGTAVDGPKINVTVNTPANARGPVPLILVVNFGGGPAVARGGPAPAAGRGGPVLNGEPPVAAEIISRGWGYATVGYQDIQPDRANAWSQGVIGLTLTAGQQQPAPGEWGTIGAWAWGISRIIDYLESDKQVNARKIAVQGHSRLGKTVLWASATDERIVATFSSCAGEMGSALSRRDWGETVDDMAQNFGYQFTDGFQKWPGRWNEMPVDAHMLIALSAPRPVFITGGTADQWADPVGEFKAEVAAGPVYRLLGKKDLMVTELPPLDTPLTSGDLGFHYHTGGHAATPADWTAFLTFVAKYL
jgi:hypothetical protein